MYPVEYASLLLNPLRRLIAPPGRLASRLDLKPTDTVLEIGCGPGYFSPTVARRLDRGRLVLFDAQPGMIALAMRRLRQAAATNVAAVVGSAEQLPFTDQAFDVVFMVTVLGEVPDQAAAMREIARVLRPGGRLSVSEQLGDADRLRQSDLDPVAGHSGLVAERAWRGLLLQTFNYRKA